MGGQSNKTQIRCWDQVGLRAARCPTQPSVWRGPEAGVRGQEVEVKGHTRSVRILCFPEVFLWSWFLLRLQLC